MALTVLSIQSHVVAGHVGNDAAVFTMQRLGVDVWPIHTVQYSNHTGHGQWRGEAFSADHIRALIDGLDSRGLLKRIDAVLSGYITSADMGAAIMDAVARVKEQNPNAIYCCDPVMGDTNTGLFVKPSVPGFFDGVAVLYADIVTPNVYELSMLTGSPLSSTSGLIDAAHELIRRGPKIVLITSVRLSNSDQIETVAVTQNATYSVSTPFVPLTPMPNGMGDCIAALFLARILQRYDTATALSLTVSSLYALVRQTNVEYMPRDLNLVQNQEVLVSPPAIFSTRIL